MLVLGGIVISSLGFLRLSGVAVVTLFYECTDKFLLRFGLKVVGSV